MKKLVLFALLCFPLVSISDEIRISLINSIYDDRDEAIDNRKFLEEELQNIFSYAGAPQVRLDDLINIAGTGVGDFTDVFAEYLANRGNAEKVERILNSGGYTATQMSEILLAARKTVKTANDIRILYDAGISVKDIAFGLGQRVTIASSVTLANDVFGEVAERVENRIGDTATRFQSYKTSLEQGNCIVAIVVGHGVTMANKIALDLSSSNITMVENQFQLIGVGTVKAHVVVGDYVYDRTDSVGLVPDEENESRITSSSLGTTIAPDGSIIPVPPPLPADKLFNYFNGDQSGIRLRGLIIDAVEKARVACLPPSEFRILDVIADDDDLVINTNTSFFNPGGTFYEIEVFYEGTPEFPITVTAALKEETLHIQGHCGRSDRGNQNCTVVKTLETPTQSSIPPIESVIIDGFYCEGWATFDPIPQTFQYSIKDANGVESDVVEHTHFCDFIY